jgi:hypothetical protein
MAPTAAADNRGAKPARVATLRYGGRCRLCQRELIRGQRALHHPTARKITCLTCAYPNMAAPESRPVRRALTDESRLPATTTLRSPFRENRRRPDMRVTAALLERQLALRPLWSA